MCDVASTRPPKKCARRWISCAATEPPRTREFQTKWLRRTAPTGRPLTACSMPLTAAMRLWSCRSTTTKSIHALKLEGLVNKAADSHHAAALADLSELKRREAFNARATPAVLLIGFVLVGLFSSVLRRTRAQLDQQRTKAVHDALHDALTGLPNRTLLADRFEQALRSNKRTSSTTAMLLIDLDRFKEVNDTLGHHVGDQLLAQIGPRLLKRFPR